jgi:cobalt-zinc-cadmium efflux system outer membrane protein
MSCFPRKAAAGLGALLAVVGCAGVPVQNTRGVTNQLLQHSVGAQALRSADTDVAAEIAALLAKPLYGDAAVRIALLRNPTMQSIYAELDIATADVFQASRLANPGLGLAVLKPGAATADRKVDGSLTLGFTDLLLLHSRRQQGAAELRSAQQRIASQIHGLALDVQQAWVSATAAAQRAALGLAIADDARLAADLAGQYHKAGNIDALSLSLHGATASEAAIEATHSARSAIRERAHLQRLMGLRAGDAPLILPDSLPLPAEPTLDRTTMLATAHAQRLDLQAARSELQAMQLQQQATRRFRWLRGGEIGAISEREGTSGTRGGVSAAVELPLFQQGQAEITRSGARRDAAAARVRELEVAIDAEVNSQLDQLSQLRTQLTLYREQLIPQRETAVTELSRQANFMLSGPFELLDAKQSLQQAESGAIEALQEYWQGHLALARALGAALPTVITEVQP